MQKLKAVIDTQKNNLKSIGSINNFDSLELELELKMDGTPIEFVSPTFELITRKPDKNLNRQIDNIVFEAGKIKIKCDEQLTISEKPGIVTNQLIIKDNGRVSSYPFYFILGSSLDSDVIQSITNIKTLEQLDEYVVVAIQKLNDFEAKLEELENNLGSGGSSSGVAGKDGKDGKSAYELAVENGFVGSLEEWLESLKGKDGEPGQPGRDGVDGVDGSDAVLSEEQVTALNSISEIKQNVEKLDEQYDNIAKKVDNIKEFDGDYNSLKNKPVIPSTVGLASEEYVDNAIKNIDIPTVKDSIVNVEIVEGVLNLTDDKYQYCNMEDLTEVVLPTVEEFAEIHLFFFSNGDLTLILPSCKWQTTPEIKGNKYYEIIFTNVNGQWLGGLVSYE